MLHFWALSCVVLTVAGLADPELSPNPPPNPLGRLLGCSDPITPPYS